MPGSALGLEIGYDFFAGDELYAAFLDVVVAAVERLAYWLQVVEIAGKGVCNEGIAGAAGFLGDAVEPGLEIGRKRYFHVLERRQVGGGCQDDGWIMRDGSGGRAGGRILQRNCGELIPCFCDRPIMTYGDPD